jgi:hypothetical protein
MNRPLKNVNFGMKCVSCLFVLSFLLSCTEAEQKPVVQKPMRGRDTNAVRRNMANPYAPIDISPMDISYFPPDYPVMKMTERESPLPVARVIYSRPHKQGRVIFGSLIKYSEPWRLGANEATEIEFFKDVTIQGQKVSRGRYVMYCIPEKEKWTIVLNSNVYSWGLRLDPTKDVYRFASGVQNLTQPVEYFTIVFQKTERGANLLIAWDVVAFQLPITL